MERRTEAKNQDANRRPRGRPKTASDSERQKAILAEARNTFHEFGYGGTTMDLVAARCKISKQTLYRLFASKTELFMAIIADHRATMLALPRPAEEHMPLADTLAKIFMVDIDEAAERDRKAFVHFIVRESQAFPEAAALLHTHGVVHSRRMLADWLKQQVDRGRIVLDDPLSGARMLMDMVFGAMASPPGRSNDWPDRQTRDQHIRGCFNVFMNGVCRKCDLGAA
ncbi:TetR/AcrR family transcriptional regulator [Rhizobium sp. 2YAF20]|uniref:TetR/AcrR family transcriptional regulator n=1 Tax=Rhizobium sp. 2YAF20 TaxID=3233027 RepID=UPI003F9B1C88